MSPAERSLKSLPSIVEASADLERWASQQVSLIPGDLALKHQHMAKAAFPFLRATFYRWTQLWPLLCPDLAKAPQVAAVGDLHVENFGTWRDAEGRLVWGVNDFDEAWPAAYAVDLVRLVTSAYVAIDDQHLTVSRKKAREAIESGYRDSIEKGGRPYVLAEKHNWLRQIALNKLRDPVRFWKKIETSPEFHGKLPRHVVELLHGCMPLKRPSYELKSRIAGLGTLGHPRVLAICAWHGAHLVREAKALTKSAWVWSSKGNVASAPLLQEQIINNSVRVPDPHLHFVDSWMVRRLAPDCCHIELCSLPKERNEERLLYAMGWETANIHLATHDKIKALKKDLSERRGRWLHKAAKAMAEATRKDWKQWRKSWLKKHAEGGAK
jgi:hypothetical protein